VTLLPDRKPGTAMAWFEQHPRELSRSSVAIDRAEIAHQAHVQAGGESIPP
jgi:hypothetical protein